MATCGFLNRANIPLANNAALPEKGHSGDC
jgi:hypothetical protein